MTTLTVDDNPLILQSMEKILTRIDPEGIHLTAESAGAALDLIGGDVPDAAFLDIEMPGGSGLDLAAKLRGLRPDTNLIFITGHSEYAMRAFELYASGYLLKPITEQQVRTALDHLRYPPVKKDPPHLEVRCFGNFEVWYGGAPVRFARSRTKQLFAYLIDRRGALCDMGQILCAIWPEEPDSVSHRSQVRVFVSDLQTTLTRLGVGGVLVRTRGQVGVDPEALECDYYAYLRGDPEAVRQFAGEYMSDYSFGEETLAALLAGSDRRD